MDNTNNAQPVQEKTYTQKEVDQMLKDKTEEVKDNAIKALVEKNSELKQDLLTTNQDEFFNITKWTQMKEMATDMVKSGALPQSDNAFTVVMKMQAGYEMGMKPIESIKSFYIVNGILNIYGAAVVKRLTSHGWTISYKEEADKCTATIKKGEVEHSETLTFEEAEKSKWTKSNAGTLKVGWIEGINRRLKLRYGALSILIKTNVPEVLGSAVDIAEVAQDTTPLFNSEIQGETVEQVEDKPATDAQKKTITQLAAKNGLKVDVDQMTYKTAQEWIAGVNQK